MRIEQKFAVNNPAYKVGRKIQPVGIVVHSVGCEQPDEDVWAARWNRTEATNFVHAIVGGKDRGKVYQLAPWTMRVWGVGSGKNGSYNNSHIHIEIAEPKSGAYLNGRLTNKYDAKAFENYFNETLQATVELCEHLMKLFPAIKIENIVSHRESYIKGYGSNHGDPEHWWKYHSYDMGKFRGAVADRFKVIEKPQEKPQEAVQGFKVGQEVNLKPGAKQWTGEDIRADFANKVYKVASVADNGRVVLSIDGVVIYAVSDGSLEGAGVPEVVDGVVRVGDVVRLRAGAKQWSGESISKTYSGKDYVVSAISNGRAVLTINNIVMYAVNVKDLLKVGFNRSNKVRVTVDALNIRKEPNTKSGIAGVIRDRGIYTIVDSVGEWGKLKSGLGWIHMGYTIDA